jgi:hypothetical protein
MAQFDVAGSDAAASSAAAEAINLRISRIMAVSFSTKN